MNAERISIERANRKTEGGRTATAWEGCNYKPWATLESLSFSEQTDANNARLSEAVVFEVRSCKKTEEMRKHLKNYRAIFRGLPYSIHGADYSRSHEGYIRLLASRTD